MVLKIPRAAALACAHQGRDPAERCGWSRSRIYVAHLAGGAAVGAAPGGPGGGLYPTIGSLGAGALLPWTESTADGSLVYGANARIGRAP